MKLPLKVLVFSAVSISFSLFLFTEGIPHRNPVERNSGLQKREIGSILAHLKTIIDSVEKSPGNSTETDDGVGGLAIAHGADGGGLGIGLGGPFVGTGVGIGGKGGGTGLGTGGKEGGMGIGISG